MNTTTQKGNDSLFWGCWIALIATSFGFIIRNMIIGDWAAEFNLSETQKGELFGVGLWPFAISIVLFSLIIDRVGYRNAMIFGAICHVASAIITIFATGYWGLYIGTFVLALGNGTVEAYINPVIATVYRKEKTTWLNRLHAAWPGGLVIGGILVILLGPAVGWQIKVGLVLIPVFLYIVMLWNKDFPVNERVAAGVSYKDMLKEVGIIGMAIIAGLIVFELSRVFELDQTIAILITAVIVGVYGFYTRSLGNPLFILFLLVMIPLATTELGTDSWITELMAPAFEGIGINAGWLIVYTSLIMMLLRFYAGPIVHRISPLGLLAASSVIAIIGLYLLSTVNAGIAILAAATLYGLGKSFFWPTTLGVVAERFPKGGALTLNGVAAVGMLGVGIIGTALLGYVQDQTIQSDLASYDKSNNTELVSSYVTKEKTGIFGEYKALDTDKLAAADATAQNAVSTIQNGANKSALSTVAFFPIIMLIFYLLLILYFRSKGGYKAVDLTEES